MPLAGPEPAPEEHRHGCHGQHPYEVIHVDEKLRPVNKIYGEQFSDEEITGIVEGMSNWVYNNIEAILEYEEKEQSQ